MLSSLERVVLARAASGAEGGEGRAWLERALAKPTAGDFALAPRKVGGAALTEAERAELGWLGVGATASEAVRVLFVVRAVTRDRDAGPKTAAEWFRLGDNEEKRAVLRALALFPEPDRHVELGRTASRTSVQSVFEALACENPWPATCLPDDAWNQMVLKALFTGVALDRIDGLDRRRNPELARMAGDFAAERRAAGRPVPGDIGRVL